MEVKIDSLVYQDFVHNWIKKIKKKNPERLPEDKLDLLYEDFDRVSPGEIMINLLNISLIVETCILKLNPLT